MIIISYKNKEEEASIVAEKVSEGYILVYIRNISEGNFLGFIHKDEMNEQVVIPKEEYDSLKRETVILKAKSQALIDEADFKDRVMIEIIQKIYE